MKTKQELEKAIGETHVSYNDVIFGNDTLICRKYLNKLKKHQHVDERVHKQRFMKNTI